MKKSPTVFVLVWTGSADQAVNVVSNHYPGCQIKLLSHRALRESGWRGQVRSLRELHGEALVFYFQSLLDLHEKLLLAWSGLLHRCRETSFMDSGGLVERYRRIDWLVLFPRTICAAVGDCLAFLHSWFVLQFICSVKPKPIDRSEYYGNDLDLAYLYPFPLNRLGPGGAMTHIQGFLGGLKEQGASCEIFAGNSLPALEFHCDLIPSKRRFFLFWEASMLAYNWSFARQVRRRIACRRVGALYQRHGRFALAGMLLSRWLRVPLILEFNGSEVWVAHHWDPSRFTPWLRLCESASVTSAAMIVVVSDVLRDQLIGKGVEARRILVNPNAVDPQHFHPECGGRERRTGLGFRPEHIVITFVGSFSYWHGMGVLEDAIRTLVADRVSCDSIANLRFLLIGDGPLREEMRERLDGYVRAGLVTFTGIVPHEEVASYLDASDILVSPHVRMPDGCPFFGSPTKLFEYMAMGKGIVASELEQISKVLQHGETGLLVPPNNPAEVAAAIRLLAQDPALRARLGRQARDSVLARHTWSRNAGNVLEGLVKWGARPQSSDAKHVAESSRVS
jgi:glycosyltransferase involved in cell wall biosynthesis